MRTRYAAPGPRCRRPDRVFPWGVSTVRQGQEALRFVVTADGERNVWFVGDDAECAVIDPAGEVGALLGHCDKRRVKAILWTNLWPESVRTAIALADYTGAVTYVHTDDLAIWHQAEPERHPQHSVPDGLVLDVGGMRLESVHTPGITPGGLCWYVPALSAVFTGETLALQGAGIAHLLASDRLALLASIRAGLFTLPSSTVVHPGRGADTRIGTQRWDRRFWS
jgi:glyoxylase-like metal-dependent hydrolase (beta-lactamase superfamily II)